MSLKTYRPGPGGLEPNPVQVQTWCNRLRSRRWKAAPLSNPEMEPTSSRMAVAFWIGLALLTFVILLFGYGIGIWGPIS
jgi:cytochrome b561